MATPSQKGVLQLAALGLKVQVVSTKLEVLSELPLPLLLLVAMSALMVWANVGDAWWALLEAWSCCRWCRLLRS